MREALRTAGELPMNSQTISPTISPVTLLQDRRPMVERREPGSTSRSRPQKEYDLCRCDRGCTHTPRRKAGRPPVNFVFSSTCATLSPQPHRGTADFGVYTWIQCDFLGPFLLLRGVCTHVLRQAGDCLPKELKRAPNGPEDINKVAGGMGGRGARRKSMRPGPFCPASPPALRPDLRQKDFFEPPGGRRNRTTREICGFARRRRSKCHQLPQARR